MQKNLAGEHLSEVRRRVLNSTKSLLVRHGYKRTTIRMIAEDSWVLIGSIYYIFRNKEDIFQSVILEMVQNAIKKIEVRCPAASPAFFYAAGCEVEMREMEAAPIIRDVYRECYDSMMVFEHMVAQYMILAQHAFDGTPYAASREVYYERTLLIKGAMRACLAELYFEREHDHRASRRALIRMALGLFGVPETEIEEILTELAAKESLWLAIAGELAERPIGE